MASKKTTKAKGAGKKKAAKKSAMASSDQAPFRVFLLDRGKNVETVKKIESGAGGRPNESTPYKVTSFETRSKADKLVGLFEGAGASAEVR